MKKLSTFIKTGVRNSTKKQTKSVSSFQPTDEPRQSHVDNFGRVVQGKGTSSTHFVRSRTDRNEDRKSIKDWRPSSGIHNMDPADIVELMFD